MSFKKCRPINSIKLLVSYLNYLSQVDGGLPGALTRGSPVQAKVFRQFLH